MWSNYRCLYIYQKYVGYVKILYTLFLWLAIKLYTLWMCGIKQNYLKDIDESIVV